MEKEQKSSFGIVGIIVVIAAIAILGGGMFLFFFLEECRSSQGKAKVCRTYFDKIVGRFKPLPNILIESEGEEPDASTWKTYRNEEYGFEVRYPSSWLQWTDDDEFPDGPWVFASVPKDKKVHGLGIPPSGEMQVLIAYGLCNNPTAEFIAEDYGRRAVVLEKTSCTLDRLQEHFQISALLWDVDPNKENHKELLESIRGTFRITK